MLFAAHLALGPKQNHCLSLQTACHVKVSLRFAFRAARQYTQPTVNILCSSCSLPFAARKARSEPKRVCWRGAYCILLDTSGTTAMPTSSALHSPQVKLVDFAHTFTAGPGALNRTKDTNFARGLAALIAKLALVAQQPCSDPLWTEQPS